MEEKSRYKEGSQISKKEEKSLYEKDYSLYKKCQTEDKKHKQVNTSIEHIHAHTGI